jgi:XTP/dITP diphosphohydrolase
MLNKILLATGNRHKKEKLSWIVKDLFSKIDDPESIGLDLDVDENGETFEENAIKKAVEFSNHYDEFVIATDGGVIIPSLKGKWDPLKTKRFVSDDATDFERIEQLLKLLEGKTGEERTMKWVEAIAIAKSGKLLFSKQVDGIRGVAQTHYDLQKYKEGIWVCSIWFFPQFKKNFFDLSPAEMRETEISWSRLQDAVRGFFNN